MAGEAFVVRAVYVMVPGRRPDPGRLGWCYRVVRIDPATDGVETVGHMRRYPGYGMRVRRMARDEVRGWDSDPVREGRPPWAAVVIYDHGLGGGPKAEVVVEGGDLSRSIRAHSLADAARWEAKGRPEEAGRLRESVAHAAGVHAAEDGACEAWLAAHAADIARWHALAVGGG